MGTTIEKTDGKIVVYPDEELNVTTAADFTKEVADSLFEGANLTVNMKNTVYMSSAGIRALMLISRKIKEVNGSFEMINCCDELKNLLETTGLTKILNLK